MLSPAVAALGLLSPALAALVGCRGARSARRRRAAHAGCRGIAASGAGRAGGAEAGGAGEGGSGGPAAGGAAPAQSAAGAGAGAAPAPVSADLAGPSPIAEIGREQCSKDDGAGYVLSSNDNGAGQQELRGRCRAWLGGAAFFFDVHWQLSHVPALGSCCIIAIVRAVANLNVQAIKDIVADSFNWVDVEAKLTKWAAYGKEDDPDAKCFREYAFRFMLDNHDNIAKHLDRDPDIEGDGDITPKQFGSARIHAITLLGGTFPTKKEMTRVQKWAVAVLCCSTHFA